MTECRKCGSTEKIQQHHVSYRNDETVPLCARCHGRVHHDPNHEYYPEDHENMPGNRNDSESFSEEIMAIQKVWLNDGKNHKVATVPKNTDIEPGDYVRIKKVDED